MSIFEFINQRNDVKTIADKYFSVMVIVRDTLLYY